jgi:hypothetical protein
MRRHRLTYLSGPNNQLINAIEESLSLEAVSRAASQKTTRLSYNPKDPSPYSQNPPPVPIPNLINLVIFNIIFPHAVRGVLN